MSKYKENQCRGKRLESGRRNYIIAKYCFVWEASSNTRREDFLRFLNASKFVKKYSASPCIFNSSQYRCLEIGGSPTRVWTIIWTNIANLTDHNLNSEWCWVTNNRCILWSKVYFARGGLHITLCQYGCLVLVRNLFKGKSFSNRIKLDFKLLLYLEWMDHRFGDCGKRCEVTVFWRMFL